MSDHIKRICDADDAAMAAVRASGHSEHDPRRADVWARSFHGPNTPSRSRPCSHPDNPPAVSMCRRCHGTGYEYVGSR